MGVVPAAGGGPQPYEDPQFSRGFPALGGSLVLGGGAVPVPGGGRCPMESPGGVPSSPRGPHPYGCPWSLGSSFSPPPPRVSGCCWGGRGSWGGLRRQRGGGGDCDSPPANLATGSGEEKGFFGLVSHLGSCSRRRETGGVGGDDTARGDSPPPGTGTPPVSPVLLVSPRVPRGSQLLPTSALVGVPPRVIQRGPACCPPHPPSRGVLGCGCRLSSQPPPPHLNPPDHL